MAILTKDRASSLAYLIPEGSPPSFVLWTLYDRTATILASAQPITPPTEYTVDSAAAGAGVDELVLTLSATPSEFSVGDVVRVRDDWGRDYDGYVHGVDSSGKRLRVADCPATASEVATCWAPTVSVPIGSSYVDETGDGWRVTLDITQPEGTTQDTIYFSVGVVSLELTISPREFLDNHPEAAVDLAHLESRKDWPRLVDAAKGRVEEKLRGAKRWHTLIVSSTGLRRVVVEAVNMILAASWAPSGVDRLAWKDDARAGFNAAVADLLASGHYDEDLGKTADSDEEGAQPDASYKVL